ncbi:16S rRNA processing protein RimM [Hanamia caeni]|jgi:16S rRNA processing protein RimM|uniref:Ribosome maturation factor RimM n=1 Tax=Hanamia caeni TaxID=2294116 RepID=A0A3M9NNZ1_9BACT|nr:PRC-barrel domain-containing protein [Hanamia caeni]RNI39057.1 16S rRNA processing protein RimM [Hanamia caeni]
MNEYFKIGKLAATFGTNGQLILQHHLGKKTSLDGLGVFFIEESRNSFLPYFITSTKIKNDSEIFVSVEGIDSKEKARTLIKKEVWLDEPAFKKFAAKTSPISFLGFTVVDNKKELGEVLEVVEQPHQVLCRILMDGKEVLVPVHENSLEKIDTKNRKLYVNLPEGLLDVYLNI